jgi:hypothetical protein
MLFRHVTNKKPKKFYWKNLFCAEKMAGGVRVKAHAPKHTTADKGDVAQTGVANALNPKAEVVMEGAAKQLASAAAQPQSTQPQQAKPTNNPKNQNPKGAAGHVNKIQQPLK